MTAELVALLMWQTEIFLHVIWSVANVEKKTAQHFISRLRAHFFHSKLASRSSEKPFDIFVQEFFGGIEDTHTHSLQFFYYSIFLL